MKNNHEENNEGSTLPPDLPNNGKSEDSMIRVKVTAAPVRAGTIGGNSLGHNWRRVGVSAVINQESHFSGFKFSSFGGPEFDAGFHSDLRFISLKP